MLRRLRALRRRVDAPVRAQRQNTGGVSREDPGLWLIEINRLLSGIQVYRDRNGR